MRGKAIIIDAGDLGQHLDEGASVHMSTEAPSSISRLMLLRASHRYICV